MTTATTPRTVRTLSWAFGFIIGGAWVSEVILANLRGASVFGNLKDSHPLVYALAPWLALCAVALTAIAGYVAAFRTGSIAAALSVGVRSGVISGVITCLIGVSIYVFLSRRNDEGPIQCPRVRA